MGHTEAGICEESVISFSDCKEIYLSEMDLYGGGMYGFYAKNGSGNIYVHNRQLCILFVVHFDFYILLKKSYENVWKFRFFSLLLWCEKAE